MSNTDRSGDRHADGGAQNRDWQAVREDIGLTRSELGSKLPCDTKTVGRWERGETSPAIAHQREMLRLLDEETPDANGGVSE